jgi:hypothetical protein
MPGNRASESECLKYLQRQFLLRACEVLPKKSERTRVTDFVEIDACGAVARCPWTHYFCATPIDGLISDDICWFLLFFKGFEYPPKSNLSTMLSPTNSPT